MVSIEKFHGYRNTRRHSKIYSHGKKNPLHISQFSRPRYRTVREWFYMDEKAPRKDIKCNHVSLYVPAKRSLWPGNIVRIQNTYSSKIQQDASFSLILPREISLFHPFWPRVQHFPQISLPTALITAGRERPIHSPSSRPCHSQPGLCGTFIPRTIQLLLPEYIKAQITSEKLVCENAILLSQMM